MAGNSGLISIRKDAPKSFTFAVRSGWIVRPCVAAFVPSDPIFSMSEGPVASDILKRDPLDAEPPLVTSLKESHQLHLAILADPSLNSASNSLAAHASTSHEGLCTAIEALIYAMLLETPQSTARTRELFHHIAVLDGYKYPLSKIQELAMTLFPRLLPNSQIQLVLLVGNLVELNCSVEVVIQTLLRYIAPGDNDAATLWLAKTLCDILTVNIKWTSRQTNLIPHIVFRFLRCIPYLPGANEARKKEIALCTLLLRQNFEACCAIGRDLLRLLFTAQKITNFEPIWLGLFQGDSIQFDMLIKTPTPPIFLQMMLRPTLENQLVYLLSEVKQGNQKRYLQWLTSYHISKAELTPCLVDIARFVVLAFHPPNRLIHSSVFQRWMLLGWLLNMQVDPGLLNEVRMAIYFDWFCYGVGDSVMNLEPGALVMLHSVHQYPRVTSACLEFLLQFHTWEPSRTAQVESSLRESVNLLVKLGVLPSFDPILTCPSLTPAVLSRVRLLVLNDRSAAAPAARQMADNTNNAGPTRGRKGIEEELVPVDELLGTFPAIQAKRPGTQGGSTSPAKKVKLQEPSPPALSQVKSEPPAPQPTPATPLLRSRPLISALLLDKTVPAALQKQLQLYKDDGSFSVLEDFLSLGGLATEAWSVFSRFPELVGNVRALRHIISQLDTAQLLQYVSLIARGGLDFFGPEPSPIVLASREWDSFEQISLWHLLTEHHQVHSWPAATLLRLFSQLLPILEPIDSELLLGLRMLLRGFVPELVSALFQLQPAFSAFFLSILVPWSRTDFRLVCREVSLLNRTEPQLKPNFQLLLSALADLSINTERAISEFNLRVLEY